AHTVTSRKRISLSMLIALIPCELCSFDGESSILHEGLSEHTESEDRKLINVAPVCEAFTFNVLSPNTIEPFATITGGVVPTLLSTYTCVSSSKDILPFT